MRADASGEAVLRRLSAGPRAAEVMPLLTTLPFDQTESAENGGFFQGTHQRPYRLRHLHRFRVYVLHM